MSEPEESEEGRRRVRRRRRAASPADMPERAPRPPSGADDKSGGAEKPRRSENARHPENNRRSESTRRSDATVDKAERGLRGLIGAGPSQLPLAAAMRARDATRPTAEDLAAAEESPIIRRNYVPPNDRDAPPTERRSRRPR